jgi:hypothetical protein
VLKDGRLQTPTGGVVTIPTAGSGAGTGGQ